MLEGETPQFVSLTPLREFRARVPGCPLGLSDVISKMFATKVDKLSRAERNRNLREFARVFDQTPLAVSTTSGEGLDELRRLMANLAKVAPE